MKYVATPPPRHREGEMETGMEIESDGELL